MGFPLISVIMPAYKCANTISRSIKSIVGQTYDQWELLIVVEKKTDDETLMIIREYCNKDFRIKQLVNENTPGIPGSLNYGISMAKGEYIARMDSDDFSYEYRFERQIKYMEENPNVMVCGSYSYIVSPNKMELCIVPDAYQAIKAYLLFENCITHPSVMFRKNCGLYYDRLEYKCRRI